MACPVPSPRDRGRNGTETGMGAFFAKASEAEGGGEWGKGRKNRVTPELTLCNSVVKK